MPDRTDGRAGGGWRASERSSALHTTVTRRAERPRETTSFGRAATPGRAGWLGVAGLRNLVVRSSGRAGALVTPLARRDGQAVRGWRSAPRRRRPGCMSGPGMRACSTGVGAP